MGLRSCDQRGRTYGKKGVTHLINKTGSRFKCNMIACITNYGLMRWMVFNGVNHKICVKSEPAIG